MKVKINCDSPLLQETLEIFLKDFLSEDKKSIAISDNCKKGNIIIGKDIKKPFTKTSLLLQLEKILNIKNQKPRFNEALDTLTNNFKKNLINLIKEYYGKR